MTCWCKSVCVHILTHPWRMGKVLPILPSSSKSPLPPLCSSHNLVSVTTPPLCVIPPTTNSNTTRHTCPNWVGYGSRVPPSHIKLLSASIRNKTMAWNALPLGVKRWGGEIANNRIYEALRCYGCLFIDSTSICGLFPDNNFHVCVK